MQMHDIWIVDAFTSVPFRGNPAGVCPLDFYPDDDKVLQRVAMEMNLPETAFPVETGKLTYQLRWFTPMREVKLCGHATLAATHVLLKTGRIQSGDTVTYQTLSGELRAHAMEKKIELDFPELSGEPVKAPAALKGLGVEFTNCQKNRDNYLVEVADYKTLKSIAPDFDKLAKLEDGAGVIVTTATGVVDYDFASRFFVPASGINEDPVTGSAHCFLAPYWAKKLNKTSFHAVQASRREGILDIRMENGRVLIAGESITTLKGQLLMPLTARTKEVPA